MTIQKSYLKKYLFFATLSVLAALGNMGVVFMINKIVAGYFADVRVLPGRYLVYFLLSLVLFFTCRWLVSIGIIGLTQKLLRKTRIEVLQMVLRSSFNALVRSKERIFTALTRDTDNIVNASVNLVDILTNLLVVVICFIYMGILSWKLLVCMVGLIAFTVMIYFFSERKARRLFALAMTQNDRFVKYLGEILSGFKEITMERRKGLDITDKHISKAIGTSSSLYQKAQVNLLNNRIIGQMAFYIFISLVMLFLGEWFNVGRPVLVNFIFLVLYVWGPIETVVLLIPSLSQASASFKRLEALEGQMVGSAVVLEQTPAISTPFLKLQLKEISYKYESGEEKSQEPAFSVGPIDFEVDPGEIIFISGGNGSGKTTFINVLVGIYNPCEGDIYLNGEKMERSRLMDYRSLFAPVFSDFHLFDECYGIPDVSEDKANEYLKLLEVDNKVTFTDGKFSSIHLSAGQRKRLALINAVLERKPVLVLDEFAADQDPRFKRKFYTEILDYIKADGFTVVAITHDDHYYGYADRLYKMDAGRIYEQLKNHPIT